MGIHSGFPFQSCAQLQDLRQNSPRVYVLIEEMQHFLFALGAERQTERVDFS